MSYREESLQRKEPPSLQALPFYALFWIGTRRQLHRHRSDESGLNTSFNATWGEPITTYCGAACKRVFLEFRQLSCALKYETSFAETFERLVQKRLHAGTRCNTRPQFDRLVLRLMT